jgi:ATP-dependent RNA helicase DeaD
LTDLAVATATVPTSRTLRNAAVHSLHTPIPLSTSHGPARSGEPSEAIGISFADLGLSEPLLRAVTDEGYTTPTPIQARAIPVLLQGRDLLGQAQTGTGKTAAFALPLLHSIDPAVHAVQALVLCPTRELALQVAAAIHDYAKHLPQLSVLPIFGGDSMTRQLSRLSRGVQVVVGTPGRVLDHLSRGSLLIDKVRFVVLDEADEMLRMGFLEDVESILGRTPAERQTALLSATLPPAIRRVAENQLRRPEYIAIETATRTVDTISQRFIVVDERYKFDALVRILAVDPPEAALIFTRTRKGADELAEALVAEGTPAEALHSDLSQAQRSTVLDRLRSQRLRVVVATDVAARGLDIDHISHVINYDLPNDLETYVHRIGRTGRAGRSGEALILLTPRERGRLRTIEQFTHSTLLLRTIPTRAAVLAKREERLLADLLPSLLTPVPERFVSLAEKIVAASGQDAVTVAALLLSQQCADRNTSRKPVPDDLQPPPCPERHLPPPPARAARPDFVRRSDATPRPHSASRSDAAPRPHSASRSDATPHPEFAPRPQREHRPSLHRPESAGVTRLLLAVGFEHGLRAQDVVGAIANEAGIPGRAIGPIEILATTTMVEIPIHLGMKVLSALRKTTVRGQQVRPRLLAHLDKSTSRSVRLHPRSRHRGALDETGEV